MSFLLGQRKVRGWREGARAEEAHLHQLADGLGLSASRSHELLVQAERERGEP